MLAVSRASAALVGFLASIQRYLSEYRMDFHVSFTTILEKTMFFMKDSLFLHIEPAKRLYRYVSDLRWCWYWYIMHVRAESRYGWVDLPVLCTRAALHRRSSSTGLIRSRDSVDSSRPLQDLYRLLHFQSLVTLTYHSF
jgi:hypothetical protein